MAATIADPWSWLGADTSEAGRLMREVDWAATSVGPVEGWPVSLRTLITTMLRARQPMFLWWGPELVQFYNDGYVPSFGVGRHPAALGQRGAQCWAEIWPIIGPEIEGVIASGRATFHEDALVPIFRNGRMEEVYWTYGYSPALDELGAVAGVLVVVTETTSRVVAGRRLQTARELAEATSVINTYDDLAQRAVALLTNAPEDTPWSVAYRTDESRATTAVASVGLTAEQVPDVLTATATATSGPMELAVDALPGTPWPERSTRAVTLTFPAGATTYTVVLGLSPRLPYDAGYEGHTTGISRQLSNAAQRIASQNARTAAEGARNDLLLQAPIAAALLVGPQWRYELANELYVRLVGRDVSGRNWHDCFPELAGGPVDAILRGVYTTGEAFFASEERIPLVREADGVLEERFFDFNMIPIRGQAGAIDAMMVVAVEMTAQVRSRRALEETAIERESLVRRLEAASRTKDAFLAMMGHELRNPLAPIVTALELIDKRGGTTREHEIIGRQVTYLTRLVDDLLDVSRITSGKIELRKSQRVVGAIVAHAVEIVTTLFDQRRHTLTVDVDPTLLWEGDGTRLEQIVVNLLTNAARYTPPGGRVRVSAAAEESTLVIRVRDTGRGIDAELLPRIFEPFVQAERSIDRREGGLGLGLSIVRGLTAVHGGTVEVHSAGRDQGSEFVVRLPGLVASLASPADVAQKNTARASAAKRVLLVDDNEDAVELMAEFFRHFGHEVVVAHDGARALAIVDEYQPDVAILDIGLPVMNGYELVQKLREHRAGKQCRFLAVTGYGQPDDIERARIAGFDRLLAKPVDLDVLLRVVTAT